MVRLSARRLGIVALGGLLLAAPACKTRVCDTPETAARCFGEPMEDAGRPADMARMPDLATLPDLTRIPDMARLPDLIIPPDLASLCPALEPRCQTPSILVNDRDFTQQYALRNPALNITYTHTVSLTTLQNGSRIYRSEFRGPDGKGIPQIDHTPVATHRLPLTFPNISTGAGVSDYVLVGMGSGLVVLAQEDTQGILNVKDYLKLGYIFPPCYTYTLADVNNKAGFAVFTRLDDSGRTVKEEIPLDSTRYIRYDSDAIVPLHVYKVSPDFDVGAMWAEAAILSMVVTLPGGRSMEVNGKPQAGYAVRVENDRDGRLDAFQITIPRFMPLDFCSFF